MGKKQSTDKEPKEVASSTGFSKLLEIYKKALDLEKSNEKRFFWQKKTKNIEENKLNVVKDLIESGIDPSGFDVLISNELDRQLKERYGIIFLILTVAFTLFSYSIIIANSIYNWGISDVAITVLLIEIPIQFIGLLYIIARNLFPQNKSERKTINQIDFGKFWNSVKITDNTTNQIEAENVD